MSAGCGDPQTRTATTNTDGAVSARARRQSTFREDAERHGKQEREEAERERDYEERYRAERVAEEPQTEALAATQATLNDGSRPV
jgi:hypothetical protein